MKASITLAREFAVANVDKNIYGSFLEHVGRAVYTGVYEPGHPESDESGFRKDVLSLVRELKIPVVRYPGGNFVSGYRWEDGVGPKEMRPKNMELAWLMVETNAFGTDEFCQWAKLAETEPIMAVNLGTRGPEEAAALVEYCNRPGGTRYADMRVQNGFKEPHAIKYWCLGNEMDGPWQIGHKTATEYARIATEAAKLMKLVDPSIKLVACGSSSYYMPQLGSWELTVLEEAYRHVDYISLHTYYGKDEHDPADFLARSMDMDRYIEAIISACDYVQAKKKGKKRIDLSFDEWNVWGPEDEDAITKTRWSAEPNRRGEMIYTLEDALVFGCMLISLLKHADRVTLGCQAQLVNVIAPILAEKDGPAWRQTIFYPYLHASLFGRGMLLRATINSPKYDGVKYTDVPYLEAVAIADETTITIFAVNRSPGEAIDLDVRMLDCKDHVLFEHHVLCSENPLLTNDLQNRERIVPKMLPVSKDGIRLPAYSWNALRFRRAERA